MIMRSLLRLLFAFVLFFVEAMAGAQAVWRVDSVMTHKQSLPRQEVTRFSFDSFNHLIANGNDENTRLECKFDDAGRETSCTRLVTDADGRVVSGFRITSEYSRKGIRQRRRQYLYTSTQKWVRGKITDGCDPWQEIAIEACDRQGRITQHYDYESGDTFRYQYDEAGRMTLKERLRGGLLSVRDEFTYDRHGNLIRIDDFYVMKYGGKALEFVYTYHIDYDLNIKADDVLGCQEFFKSDDLCGKRSIWRNLTEPHIGYYPEFVNLPVRVSRYSHEIDREEVMYIYCSRISQSN